MLEINDVYKLDENVVLRSINDKFWALDTRLGTQYKLNRVSYDVLSLLDGNKKVNEIIDNTSRKYDVSKDVLINDTIVLLDNALSKKIIMKGGE